MEQSFKIYEQESEYFISAGTETQVIHWIDDEFDAEIETVYLMFITGHGNSAVLALYSGFSEQEAIEKLIEETGTELHQIAHIEPVEVTTI